MAIARIVPQYFDDHGTERLVIEHLVLLKIGAWIVRKDIHVIVFTDCRRGRRFPPLGFIVRRNLGLGVSTQFQVLYFLHLICCQHLNPPLVWC